MGFTYLQKMPSVEEILLSSPLPAGCAAIKQQRDEEIRHIISGMSPRFLVIIGPCSAHDEYAVYDYVIPACKA